MHVTFENIPEVPRGTTGALFFFFTGLKRVVEQIIALFHTNDDTWTVPLLLNGWEHYGEPYQPASYRKDMLSVVHLEGVIKSGTPGDGLPAFILPPAFRPNYQMCQPVSIDDVSHTHHPSHVEVSKHGEVFVHEGSSTKQSIGGLHFRVGEQNGV